MLKKISKKIKRITSKKLPIISAPVVVLPPNDPVIGPDTSGPVAIHNPSTRQISAFPTTNVPTQNMDSTTTAEQDLHSAGQRKINYIWEYSQAIIALMTVAANIVYIFLILFIDTISPSATTAATLLANAFFLVIGFYFGRTNHARMGEKSKDTLS